MPDLLSIGRPVLHARLDDGSSYNSVRNAVLNKPVRRQILVYNAIGKSLISLT